VRLSTHSINNFQQFQFEHDLEVSRVYRKAKCPVDEFEFRSFTIRSGAWTALSDISLSDISAISFIALPISPNDIVNGYHFVFRTPTTTEEDERRNSVPPSLEIRNFSTSLRVDGCASTKNVGSNDADPEQPKREHLISAAQSPNPGAAPLSRSPRFTQTSLTRKRHVHAFAKDLTSPTGTGTDRKSDNERAVESSLGATQAAVSSSLYYLPTPPQARQKRHRDSNL
jgi:hypothetical protein